MVAQPGDTFKLTCEYDNSEMNQQVVNGERLTPKRVSWGDGTLDEMCLSFITVLDEHEEQKARCEGLDTCRASCENPDSFECLNNCVADDPDCSQCAFISIEKHCSTN